MGNQDILYLDSIAIAGPLGEMAEKFDYTYLDYYELPNADLSPYICMIITGSVDQEFMMKHKAIIRDFLDSGKVVVFGGHLFRSWLPGAGHFIPRTIHEHWDYHITPVNPDHPFFAGVELHELTYRKGVAGFYARGHHPMPQGAEALLQLPGGEPTMYIDRVSTQGTLLVSAGATLLSYGLPEMTTAVMKPRVLAWIREEYRRLQAQKEAV